MMGVEGVGGRRGMLGWVCGGLLAAAPPTTSSPDTLGYHRVDEPDNCGWPPQVRAAHPNQLPQWLLLEPLMQRAAGGGDGQHRDGFPRNVPRLVRVKDSLRGKDKRRAEQGGESVDVPSSNACPTGLKPDSFFPQ